MFAASSKREQVRFFLQTKRADTLGIAAPRQIPENQPRSQRGENPEARKHDHFDSGPSVRQHHSRPRAFRPRTSQAEPPPAGRRIQTAQTRRRRELARITGRLFASAHEYRCARHGRVRRLYVSQTEHDAVREEPATSRGQRVPHRSGPQQVRKCRESHDQKERADEQKPRKRHRIPETPPAPDA